MRENHIDSEMAGSSQVNSHLKGRLEVSLWSCNYHYAVQNAYPALRMMPSTELIRTYISPSLSSSLLPFRQLKGKDSGCFCAMHCADCFTFPSLSLLVGITMSIFTDGDIEAEQDAT